MELGVWITFGGVVLMLFAEQFGWTGLGRLAKPVASTGFLLTALWCGALESTFGTLVFVGLALSWVGDVALLSRRPRWFMVGLVSFAVAHLAYAAASWAHGVGLLVFIATGAALVLPARMVLQWLRPHVPTELKRPVGVYVALITVMVAAAAGAVAFGAPTRWLLAAVAFYLSDLSVARDRFVRSGFVNHLWGWPLYYAAQIAFAMTAGDLNP